MEIATHVNATPQFDRVSTKSPFSLISIARSTHRPAAHSHTNFTSTDPTMNAAYATTSPLVHSQAHTGSSYSIQSRASNRSSNTTDGTSHSTLFPPLPMSTPPGPGTPGGNEVTANDNVMNSVADASSSLFQICVALRQRLKGVPGCEEAFLQIEAEAEEDTDPVTLLWRTIRRGKPLISIYTLLRPGQPMNLPDPAGPNPDIKRGKKAAFYFLQACMTDLRIPQEKLFIITDLYADDTTGFVKVARVLNWGLDELVRRGDIEDFRSRDSEMEAAAKGKRTQRQHIVAELVTTERTYVTHLELLQTFKKMVEERGIIPGDACHHIFLNLNQLLDFQRRFLIRVEQVNSLPEQEQNWGAIFQLYDQGFKVYEPYIANQAKCERMVVQEFPRLKEAGGSIEMRQMVETAAALYGFLMKPFQRLSKYPLLLEDLYKKGDLDEEKKQDLLFGKEVITKILQDANKAVDATQKEELVRELSSRVDDWKGLDLEAFGKLLMYSPVTLLKGDNISSSKDSESQFSFKGDSEEPFFIYLFEKILCCCKPIDPAKPKSKLGSRSAAPVDKNAKPKFQLKGRIFMQNVTDVVSFTKPGSYTCQVFWNGGNSMEHFVVRFASEDLLNKWAAQLQTQRDTAVDELHRKQSKARGSNGVRSGTSSTEFSYLQSQPTLENPHLQHDDDDDDEEDLDGETMAGSTRSWSSNHFSGRTAYSQNRNDSTSSLRSRSTTGESTQASLAATSSRSPPPRFAPGSLQQQQLAVRTRDLPSMSGPSPGITNGMDSYFSPTGESPASSLRTSSNSGVYPFPTQQLSQNSYYAGGDNHGQTRFTAPAMPRPQASRESSGASNGYAPPGRAPASRPSFSNNMHSAQATAYRNRSASSPDIHNGQRLVMRGNQPPVPDMPTPYQHSAHVINRSQNNSPNLPLGRASPQAPRDRLLSASRQESSPTEYPSHPSRHMPPPSGAPSRSMTPLSSHQSHQQVPAQQSFAAANDASTSSQLRVKVYCNAVSQILTLVVPTSISYASLKDRIDAKLQRSTNLCLGERGPKENQVKLKYLDEDDYVSIQSDEDVQTAFEAWREAHGHAASADGGFGMGGLLGEIELFCQK